MQNAYAPPEAAGPGAAGDRRPPTGTRMLRALLGLQAVLVLAQGAFAGQFLSGNSALLTAHQVNADLILLVGTIQIVPAILVWRPGRGPVWVPLLSLLLWIVVGMQVGFGYEGRLAFHVPLGVSLFGIFIILFMVTGRLTPAHPDTPTQKETRGRGRHEVACSR